VGGKAQIQSNEYPQIVDDYKEKEEISELRNENNDDAVFSDCKGGREIHSVR
jgi:hypothetical protein